MASNSRCLYLYISILRQTDQYSIIYVLNMNILHDTKIRYALSYRELMCYTCHTLLHIPKRGTTGLQQF